MNKLEFIVIATLIVFVFTLRAIIQIKMMRLLRKFK